MGRREAALAVWSAITIALSDGQKAAWAICQLG